MQSNSTPVDADESAEASQMSAQDPTAASTAGLTQPSNTFSMPPPNLGMPPPAMVPGMVTLL